VPNYHFKKVVINKQDRQQARQIKTNQYKSKTNQDKSIQIKDKSRQIKTNQDKLIQPFFIELKYISII
jgi:hypothetical protein